MHRPSDRGCGHQRGNARSYCSPRSPPCLRRSTISSSGPQTAAASQMDSSCLRKVKATFHIELHPSKLQNVDQGVAEHLGGLLFRLIHACMMYQAASCLMPCSQVPRRPGRVCHGVRWSKDFEQEGLHCAILSSRAHRGEGASALVQAGCGMHAR